MSGGRGFMVRPPTWVQVTFTTKLHLRRDSIARVVQRLWLGPVIFTWLPPQKPARLRRKDPS